MNGTTVCDAESLTFSADNRADYSHISVLCFMVVHAELAIDPRELLWNTVWAVHNIA